MPRRKHWKRGLAAKRRKRDRDSQLSEECNLIKKGSDSEECNLVKKGSDPEECNLVKKGSDSEECNLVKKGSDPEECNLVKKGSDSEECNLVKKGSDSEECNLVKKGSDSEECNLVKKGSIDHFSQLFNSTTSTETNQSSYSTRRVRNRNETEVEKSCSGNFHQADARFGDYAGKQCVANSFVSIMYNTVKRAHSWDSEDLDLILITGNDIYRSLQMSPEIQNRFLLVSDLPSSVELFGQGFTVRSGESYVGLIGGNTEHVDCDIIMSLDKAINKSLSMFDACLVTFAESTFAVVWSGQRYCVFDSHSRSAGGVQAYGGKSVSIRYQHLEEVYQHCSRLASSMNVSGNTLFEVTGMNALTNVALNQGNSISPGVIDVDDCKQLWVKEDDHNSNQSEPPISLNDTPVDCKSSGESDLCMSTMQCPSNKILCGAVKELTDQANMSEGEVCVVSSEQISYEFNPLTPDVCPGICSELGIHYQANDCPSLQACSGVLGEPTGVCPIVKDGNCFFRAISYCISGTENNHGKIRRCVVKHLCDNPGRFVSFLRRDYVTMEDYIRISRMKYVSTWATELEILATADFLNVDIYTYCSSWLKYSISQLDKTQTPTYKKAIYLLNRNESHYEVVTNVKHTVRGEQNRNANCQTMDKNLIEGTVAVENYVNGVTQTYLLPLKRKMLQITEPNMNKRVRGGIRENKENKRNYVRKVTLENHTPRSVNGKRTSKQLAVRNRYKNNEEYRESEKRRSAKNYRQNRLYAEGKKTRNIRKYADDQRHREQAIESSVAKYATNDIHRGNVKHYSIQKYAQDEKHREKTKRYSKQKYAQNEKHRENTRHYSKQKYAQDESHRKNTKHYSKEKYAQDESHRENTKHYSKQKYAQEESHRENTKHYSKEKYAKDEKHRESVKHYNSQKYAQNEVYSLKMKSHKKMKYASDVMHRNELKANRAAKYSQERDFREKVKASLSNKYSQERDYREMVKRKATFRYKQSEIVRQTMKDKNTKKRKQKKAEYSHIRKVISSFRRMIKFAPDRICSVCHRRLFAQQVIVCRKESYAQKCHSVQMVAAKCISETYLHKCESDCHDPCFTKQTPKGKLWICYTCHRKLLSGKMPAEAAVNNLHLEPIPKSLMCLNSLENHLIARHIPFTKVVALPKGAQRAAHGPVVCVPSNIDKTVSVLPRPASEDQMMRMKLKRKLSYKGHYEYQFMNTTRVEQALNYLKLHNKYYTDISFNNDWINPLPPNNDNHENGDSNKDGDGESDLAQNENNDDVEQQSHINDHGMYMNSCLQPVDIGQEILDQYTDKTLCVAPAENNNPVKILTDESNEAKSFPVMFPTGTPTFHDNREERITLARYLHTRLMHADGRFARNTDYIFYAQYLSEVNQVLSSVSIALRKSFVNTSHDKVEAKILLNKDKLKEILKCDSGYRFLKPIRGTPAFWQSAQKDLFAMLKQLGIPTWFCSFSAGDMRWTEILQALLNEEEDSRDVEQLEWSEKCELIRRNPITAARMFEHRFHCFLKEVILSPGHPIGKISDYFYRVEFQQRGSPHTHCLFWVEDAPKFGTDSDESVVAFIDRYVTCAVPDSDDEELYETVTSVQKHSSRHSKSCKKKGTKCRFNYPRPPSKRTFLANSRKSDQTGSTNQGPTPSPLGTGTATKDITKDEAKEILTKIWKALDDPEQNFQTVDDVFSSVGINQDSLERAFAKITKKDTVVLQRNPKDVWINQYNADLLRCWNANMDIQYILDAYSCVVYIISYISKAEREMGLLLDHAQKEALDGNEDAKQTMKKLGAVYLHNREVCAQEAVYRVCNLNLKECSRKVQFIPVGENTVKMSLPLSVIQQKSKEGDVNVEDIWMHSLVERYKNRPKLPEFEFICLASFCSEYRIVYKSEIVNTKSETRKCPIYELQNGCGYVQQRSRTKPAVIRHVRFSRQKDSEKYYQSILQLFLPHRTDNQLKPESFETYQNFYETAAVLYNGNIQEVQIIVERNKALFEIDADEIDKAEETFEKSGHLEDAWAQICPETEAERLDCLNEKVEETLEAPDENDIPDLIQNEKRDYTLEVRNNVLPKSEAEILLRSLNEKQRQIFYQVREWCLNKVNGNNPPPMCVYITGGAGTGKSHLIKSIHYEASRILARILPCPDDISVLLTAPTGVAAFNINASTIHTTFSIGVEAKLPYQPLGEEKLNTLRSRLGSLQILIIDEISMVDHKLLAYVHGRLRQIKQCRDYSPFGNVSVIAVGDFYQLSPVKGKPLYAENIGFDLWSENFRVVELTDIMRQKDASFAALLNRLRTKTKGENLSSDDKEILSKRETGEDGDAIHIYATNNQVDKYNLDKLLSICSDPVEIEAEDYFKDTNSGKLTKRDTHFVKVYNTNLARRILIAEGARVMLTKNIDVSDGLVNGVFGTVSHVSLSTGKSFPSVIYVIFDQPKVGEKLRKRTPTLSPMMENSTPISPKEDRVNNSGGLRRQFPLKLSFACTVHKMQGVTINKAVVSLAKIFSPGQSYVALSRVTSLDGLIIEDFNESAIYCNERVADAMTNMSPLFPSVKAERLSTDINWRCKIVLHNVQGLKSHISDIKSDLRFLNADFICLSETWLSSADIDQEELSIEGFNFDHKPRERSYNLSDDLFSKLQKQQHGGVGIFHKINSHFELLNLTAINMECLALYSADHNIVIVVIYRPLSYILNAFKQSLVELLDELDKFCLGCLVMGDFNENLFESSTILKLMESRGFLQYVTKPTTEGGTLIDHVYARRIDNLNVYIVPTYFSYHEAVAVCM